MKIAFLTPDAELPGRRRSFYAGLAPPLAALGHEVTILGDVAALQPGTLPVVDGMMLPDLEPRLDDLVARDALAVIHHVSAKAGRDAAARKAVHEIEQRMLPRLRRVVATSEQVAERLGAEFGIAEPRVFQPGLEDYPRNAGSGADTTEILCVGVMTRRKGQDRLLQALARLTDLDWTLTIAGDAERDPVYAREVRAIAETLGLSSRVTLVANPSDDALDALWRQARLFALTSRWEGYAAAVAQALRRGIPVIASDVAGVSKLVPDAAGILCDPADPVTLSKCMRRVLADDRLRSDLAEGAWQTGMALPGWPQQALAFERILKS